MSDAAQKSPLTWTSRLSLATSPARGVSSASVAFPEPPGRGVAYPLKWLPRPTPPRWSEEKSKLYSGILLAVSSSHDLTPRERLL